MHNCPAYCAKVAPVIGRVLIGTLFLAAGIQKLMGGAGMIAGYIGGTLTWVGALATPLAWMVIAIEILTGLALIIGFKTRWAAMILVAFTVLATLFFHPFWSDMSQLGMFLKNIAIIGGLLYVHVYGAGAWSIDNKRTSTPLATEL